MEARLERLEGQLKANGTEMHSLRMQVANLQKQNQRMEKTIAALQSQQASTARKEEEESTPPMKRTLLSNEATEETRPDLLLLQHPTSREEQPCEPESDGSTACKRQKLNNQNDLEQASWKRALKDHSSTCRRPLVSSWADIVQLLKGVGPLVSKASRIRPQFVEKFAYGAHRIYVEQPRVRRRPYSDKWLNSGGVKGSSTNWMSDDCGVRKRYGKFESGHPRCVWHSKFEEYTLLRGSPANPVEDKSSVVYVLFGAGVGDDVERHQGTSTAMPRPLAARAAARKYDKPHTGTTIEPSHNLSPFQRGGFGQGHAARPSTLVQEHSIKLERASKGGDETVAAATTMNMIGGGERHDDEHWRRGQRGTSPQPQVQPTQEQQPQQTQTQQMQELVQPHDQHKQRQKPYDDGSACNTSYVLNVNAGMDALAQTAAGSPDQQSRHAEPVRGRIDSTSEGSNPSNPEPRLERGARFGML